MENYDFSGWATKNNLNCSDGRTILKDAFKHNDGQTVPLVWNHKHDESFNVLGHALLENRDEGVYAYCKFNDTESGQNAKMLVEHGDVTALSIYANQLKQNGGDVFHGAIREVSLVLAGANPGAFIDSVMAHSEDGEPIVSEDEGVLYTGETITLFHADSEKKDESAEEKKSEGGKTIADVYNDMTEEQQKVVCAMITMALEDAKESDNKSEEKTTENKNEKSEGGNDTMKHNCFDESTQVTNTLSHADVEAIFKDAKRCGSLKEAVLAHADAVGEALAHAGSTAVEESTGSQTYGIVGADDWLFPEARTMNNPPEWIKRPDEWVATVMQGVHKTPFSRIKSMFADITEDDARAKGYIKGKLKKEEFFTLIRRTTTPTTIYKKQKMDRDDVIDITDFDVVAWLKAEMRMMLDEELARAILVGDGRPGSSEEKVNELNIRPIYNDDDLFTIKADVTIKADATADERAKTFIRTAVKSRKNYRGSGEPTLFTTEDNLTDLLLLEDSTGRVIYDSMDKLKSVLRVKNIVTVPVMETVKDAEGNTVPLMGIIVNLKDYNVGADKGGAVNMFDDFDIDYNQQKYLIETRCSGALTKPYSAIVLTLKTEG